MVRECTRCQTAKPLADFGLRRERGQVKPQPYCRPCMVEYHRAWRATAVGGARFAAKQAASKARYPDRERARISVSRALASGRLHRGACELAGQDCSAAIDAHHDDYSRPLDVRWVCRRHHRQLDKLRRARPSAGGRQP